MKKKSGVSCADTWLINYVYDQFHDRAKTEPGRITFLTSIILCLMVHTAYELAEQEVCLFRSVYLG